MHSFTLSLLLLPALASLASSADKLPPLNAFQNRKISEFLFFFFHTGTKAVEQWSEITADVQAVFFPYTIIMHAQRNKSSFEDKPHYLNIYINTQYVKMTKTKDQVL